MEILLRAGAKRDARTCIDTYATGSVMNSVYGLWPMRV
jgi:hypothetical protein